MKNTQFRIALGCALALSASLTGQALAQTAPRAEKPSTRAPKAAPSAAPAQPAPKADRIMTIDELRACMKLNAANEATAAAILQTQQSFKADEAAVKAEQVEVNKAGDALRAKVAAIVAERDALNALVPGMNARAASLKTDEEKAAYEADRAKLVERSQALQRSTDSYNTEQQPLRDRVEALNLRIAAVNQRATTVNDLVEPHQNQVLAWREQCGNRRFREEDEVVVKKELAAGK